MKLIGPVYKTIVGSHHFVVTRLLPRDHIGFQYRIKGAAGQERVVAEAEITLAQ